MFQCKCTWIAALLRLTIFVLDSTHIEGDLFNSPMIDANKKLSFILGLSGIGTWEMDLSKQELHLDVQCQNLYGLPEQETITIREFLQQIYTPDQPAVAEAITKLQNTENNGLFDIQFRLFGLADENPRWIHCRGAVGLEPDSTYHCSGIAQDITTHKTTKRPSADTLAEMALEGASAGWFTINAVDDHFEHSKTLARILTGMAREGMDRSLFISHIHPEDAPIRELAYQIAEKTGKLTYEARFVWHDGSVHWVHIMGTYQYNAEGELQYFSGIARDITSEITTRQALQASEERFRSIVEQAPVATCLFVGREMRIEVANELMLSSWGKGRTALGKPLAEAVPELVGQPFLQILDEVYVSGKEFKATRNPAQLEINGVLDTYYFDFTYKPLFSPQGDVYAIMDMAVDVTEEVRAMKKLEESELFARSIIYNSPVAKLVLTGEDMLITTVNENMLGILGRTEDIVGQPFMQAIPELFDTPLRDRLKHVFLTGQTYYQAEERIELVRYGKPHVGYYNYIYKPLYNTSHVVYGIIVTATEITEQVVARQKVEEAEIALRGAVDLAQLATWSLDLETGIASYSERFMAWLGITQATQLPEQSALNLPESYRQPVTNAIVEAISGGVYKMEHPIINQKTGDIRIIHVQGQVIYDESQNPRYIKGTAQDVTEQRLKQEELEQLVKLRTDELAVINEALAAANADLTESNQLLLRSNSNLEQFAYIASHDLQEPLRKIQSFGDILKKQYGQELGEGKTILERMQAAANRMSLLIKDLLIYSRLSSQPKETEQVNLNQVIATVASELELRVQETGAKLEIDSLPMVSGDNSQLEQLFQNLLSNSLKFHKPHVAPHIRISYELVPYGRLPVSVKPVHLVPYYHHIAFVDNGIGFEEQYADRIFQVFQRLHGKAEYPGTGIGLAICEKVVINHGGAIWASSILGEGAAFHIYFPLVEN